MAKRVKDSDFLDLPTDFAIIEAQMDRWARAHAGHQKWAEIAAICTEFFEGQQWTAEEKAVLVEEGRPCITLNKIAPLVRLLLGHFRQNRYDIKFFPGNDGSGTQEIAEAITAVIKQIAEMNQSDWNDAQVMQDGLQTGRGFWDIRLDFERNYLGEIKERVLDPFSTYIDPEADEYAPAGWNYWMYNRWMSPTDIWLLYGEKGVNEIESLGNQVPIQSAEYDYAGTGERTPPRYFSQTDDFFTSLYENVGNVISPFHHVNRFRKLIRVLDCQHKELKRCRYFIDLETGIEKEIPESWPREKINRVLQWFDAHGLPIDARESVKKKVRWTVTAGDRVLFDKWSPYGDFTVVPYFPYFRRGVTRGMIEDLLDPQREINRRRSATLHIVMSTANAGWVIEEGSMEEAMERALEDEGARPGIIIKYREGYQPPKRIEPVALPVAMKKLEDDSANDLKEISNINDSALGQLDRVQSGRAIQARQKQAIVGAEPYFDNFSRSRELKARNMQDIVQTYYTEPRLVRIRSGRGGQPEETFINRKEAAGVITNDVTLGRYDLAISEAPVSATFMQGQFQEAMEMLKEGVPIPPDVLVKLSSIPEKEETIKRIQEEKTMQDYRNRMEALGLTLQSGLPVGTPPPPVITDDGPNVVKVPAGAMGAPGPTPTPGQPPAAPAGAPLPPGVVPPGAPPALPAPVPGGRNDPRMSEAALAPLPQGIGGVFP